MRERIPEEASNLILSFLAPHNDRKVTSSSSSLASNNLHESENTKDETNNVTNNNTSYIREWKPSTTQSLLTPSSLIGSCDVIDHTFGQSFLTFLKAEVHKNNLIDRLKPAKTAMDHKINDLAKKLSSFSGSNDLFLNSSHKSARGDLSVIIPRSFRASLQFQSQYPFLYTMISSIENSAKRNLTNKSTSTSSRIDFDFSMTSVQFASYPGDSTSGYSRHCDTGKECSEEVVLESQFSDHDKAQRIISAVYYLTDDDWQVEDGGCLRIFGDNSDSGRCVGEHYHDILPYADRLVLFRSDLVEHEVLPSTKKTRIAITVWLYGRFMPKTSRGAYSQNTAESIVSVKRIPSSSQKETMSEPVINADIEVPPLPIDADSSSHHDIEKIFVSIPSYRDTEIHPTIISLIKNATFSDRIVIGVVYQYDTTSGEEQLKYQGQRSELPMPWAESNLRSLTLDYRDATGPCYARYLAQSLHRDEEYILQIDSHMRFRPRWDEYLIQQLHKSQNPERSVLTTYPPGYSLPNIISPETRATILVPWKFDKDMVLRQKGRLLRKGGAAENGNDSHNIRCLLYAAGFNFSSSKVIEDCPYDGTLHHLFFGEEISMAIRLYTCGYDLFTTPTTVCYHLWSRDHRPNFQTDFGTCAILSNHEMAHNEKKSSMDKIRGMCLGEGENLGSARRTDMFWNELGVEFASGRIRPSAENSGLDPRIFVMPSSTAGDMQTDRIHEVLELVATRKHF